MIDLDSFATRLSASGGDEVMLCAGCVDAGHCQFGVTSVRRRSNVFEASVRADRRFEGGPGVMHGGWTAAVFDEVLGTRPLALGVLAVTESLTVRYRRPVPVDRDLTIEATIKDRSDGRLLIHGVMRPAGSSVELASASGTWVKRALSHFSEHESRLSDLTPGLGPTVERTRI